MKKTLSLFIYFVIVIGFFYSCNTPDAQTSSDKPNIIFVMADDLGYGDLGCYGQKVLKTPNLDKMASEGMQFTNEIIPMVG